MSGRLRHEIPRFLLAGGLASGTHAAVYLAFVTPDLVAPVPATLIGVGCGTVVSYVLNSRYTFRAAPSAGSFVRFWIVTGVGAAVNAVLVAAGVGVGLHEAPVGLVAIALAAACNFVGHRVFTFRAAVPPAG